MSVKEQMGYALACDFPGCSVQTRDLGDYGFWGDIGSAVDEWTDHDGYSGDLGDFCYEHTVWSDEEDEESDGERVPMQHTLENLFALAERRVRERIDVCTRSALLRHERRCADMAQRDANRRSYAERSLRDLAERLAALP
ncbi:hypothetical protein [Microbacterium sp. 5K110]|jgi:hypothetical protein|uniref:hypothetical protein n=1 Tax=unclassified Microbacterium TaxID=2609290 RepID=UPI0010FD36B8|nr:hypothetical protein [Microbacterium sp. 5K110]TLF33943.1 hypothetical protein FE256_02160 [Microbacterium sp. 5K110]